MMLFGIGYILGFFCGLIVVAAITIERFDK